MRLVRIAVPTIAAALALTACSGGGSAPAAPSTTTQPAAVQVTATPATAQVVGQRALSTVKGALVVRRKPSAAAAVLTKLPATTPLGSMRVLLVDKVSGGWVKVQLPVRPNGVSGWVAAKDVKLEPVMDRLVVSLRARTLTLYSAGQPIATGPVGIGTTANPTPTGTFYVTDRVQPSTPNGAYGAFALGLSAHSTTLSEFGNGDGQIGIHGTNDPGSIGKAVSHGCIRVGNTLALKLAQVPLGTPVVIE